MGDLAVSPWKMDIYNESTIEINQETQDS